MFSDRNFASFFMDGAAILMVIGIIINTAIYRKRNKFEDKLFFQLLLTDILIGVSDILVAIANGRTFAGAKILNLTSFAFIYILQALFGLVMSVYLTKRLTGDEKKAKKLAIPMSIPIILIILMYLVGIPNGFFLKVDDSNMYQYGQLYPIPVALMGLYALLAIVLTFLYNRTRKGKGMIPFWLYLIPIAAMIVVPYVFKGISLSAVGFAVILAYMHTGVMNETFYDEENRR